jgi:uncharacterized integral membrane protein
MSIATPLNVPCVTSGSSRGPPRAAGGTMRQIYFIAGMVLGVAVALFAVQNGVPVEVRLFLWQVEGPLAAIVLGAAAAGLLVALLLGLPDTLLSRWRMRQLERQVQQGPPETQPTGSADAGVRL